jgi:ketosteroid isomerase-like protein
MGTLQIGKRYVELCQAGKNEACLDELYANDAVSVEAAAMPGMDRVVKGLDGLRAKSKQWEQNNVVHGAEVNGPYPNENRFAVRFKYDVTNKPTGKRSTMEEVALFTVENGKITREEFFYPTEG